MRTSLISATVVAGLLAIFAVNSLSAQRPGAAAPAAGDIAVVDYAFIFKNSEGMKRAQETMKRDMEAASTSLQAERKKITQQIEALKGFKPGSPDYKQQEAAIAKAQADLNVKASLIKKDFRERESKAYYGVLQEVNELVKAYSESKGIQLVLQFSGEPVDSSNPDSIVAGLTRQVVYHGGPDITPIILAELNRRAGAPRTGARPANPATRPAGGVRQ